MKNLDSTPMSPWNAATRNFETAPLGTRGNSRIDGSVKLMQTTFGAFLFTQEDWILYHIGATATSSATKKVSVELRETGPADGLPNSCVQTSFVPAFVEVQ
jgi:hypothetical protein